MIVRCRAKEVAHADSRCLDRYRPAGLPGRALQLQGEVPLVPQMRRANIVHSGLTRLGDMTGTRDGRPSRRAALWACLTN